MNRRQAIRARCLDCSGFNNAEVRNCTFDDCPLFPFRMGTGKQDPTKRDKAIRAFCLWCMNGQKKEVQLCPSEQCPLYAFNRHIERISGDKNASEGKHTG